MLEALKGTHLDAQMRDPDKAFKPMIRNDIG